MRTLLVGIGNPGRRDDGLGPALVERLTGSRPPERSVIKTTDGTTEAFWAYQLNIEDAAIVRDYDRVVFADADAGEPESVDPKKSRNPGARLEAVKPAASIAFTTHEMSPGSVLSLAEELYGKAPAGFLLKIRGTEWDFAEGLSAEAERNLDDAVRILGSFINDLEI